MLRGISSKNCVNGIKSFLSSGTQGFNKKLYSQVAMKSDGYSSIIKGTGKLAKKARKLIFSERKYLDFTLEEKKIVDTYQEKILEIDGGMILPNTSADLQQREIEQLIKGMHKN